MSTKADLNYWKKIEANQIRLGDKYIVATENLIRISAFDS